MKKYLIGFLAVLLLLFGGLKLTEALTMGGTDYYVQVTSDGKKQEEKDDNGQKMISYDYQLPGYDEDGKEKRLHFSAFKDRPLVHGAYLKVTWNKKKGVTSYEQVDSTEIPREAKSKLGGK